MVPPFPLGNLRNYISPVVQSRGSPGEGDLPMMSNIGAGMVGAGQAYLRGQRMPARWPTRCRPRATPSCGTSRTWRRTRASASPAPGWRWTTPSVAQEMLSASYWMEVRKAQNPDRSFGAAPASALQALRAVIPWQQQAVIVRK